ncbi:MULTISPECIES: hypothetical protein [unclassified Spiroplasma]|uniref:hypothetical protein n=1 Tax=unclassified Spiroplasma TaxID=2637901 RepID=UPI0030D5BDA7
MLKKIYKEIFSTMLVIDNKDNKFCFKINIIKTSNKIRQKYNIKKEIINDLLLPYKNVTSYSTELFPLHYLLENISKDIINNNAFQKILNKNIINKIEKIYKKYQDFDHDFQKRFFYLEVAYNIKTPTSQLEKNLQKIGLQSFKNILINQGTKPIKEIFNIQNNKLLATDINKLDNNLLPVNNCNNKSFSII